MTYELAQYDAELDELTAAKRSDSKHTQNLLVNIGLIDR
jgi:hypothetical protein